jgi:hypothetical protein
MHNKLIWWCIERPCNNRAKHLGCTPSDLVTHTNMGTSSGQALMMRNRLTWSCIQCAFSRQPTLLEPEVMKEESVPPHGDAEDECGDAAPGLVAQALLPLEGLSQVPLRVVRPWLAQPEDRLDQRDTDGLADMPVSQETA